MSYGPHHQPLKATDVVGTTALIGVFTVTITAALLGALNLPTLPSLAWSLIFAVLPWIQAWSIREYDPLCRPYLKSMLFMAKLGTSFVTGGLTYLLFDDAEQSPDPVLRISCWVLIAAFPAINALILSRGMLVADWVLNGRVLPWLRR